MKKVLIILFINFAIIVFILFCGELFLRYHYFSLPTDKFHLPHPYLQVILNPDLKFRKNNETLGIFNLRRTGTYNEGSGVYKIIAIGDSCTFSVGSSSEATSFPTLLENSLSSKFHRKVEVYNAGVPGYNSMQMLLKLNMLLKEVNPDEVIIYGGWNDFRVLGHDRGRLYIENNTSGLPYSYRYPAYWEINRKDNENNFFDHFLNKSFLYEYIKFPIVAQFEKKKIRAFWKKNGLTSIPQPDCVLTPVIRNFNNNMENIVALAKGRGAKVSVITLASPLKDKYTIDEENKIRAFEGKHLFFLRLTPAEERRYLVEFNATIKKLSRKYRAELYDWEKWYEKDYNLDLFTDHVHPNDKGYRYLVNRIMLQRNKL